MDITGEGRAERITDRQILQRLAEVYSSQAWPATATATAEGFTAAYSASSAAVVAVCVEPDVGTSEPHGATRWRF